MDKKKKRTDWTLTAVPLRPAQSLLISRYLTARSLFHDANTASMAILSCVSGSAGNVLPLSE